MNVLVCTENHFVEVGTDVFSNQTSPEFFQRYLDAWEEVKVLGRVSCAESAPQGFHKVEMNGIRLVGLPDFYGPEQYLRNFRVLQLPIRVRSSYERPVLFPTWFVH
jgi:hypothetical protein